MKPFKHTMLDVYKWHIRHNGHNPIVKESMQKKILEHINGME